MIKPELDPARIDWGKPGGLVPAVVQDARTRDVLMLGYMNPEALARTLADGLVTFFSRTRQRLWQKGETSGNHLTLTRIRLDCDQDTLLVEAIPAGPTCHQGTDTCFGDTAPSASWLALLEDTINERAEAGSPDSYTREMLRGGPPATARKFGEEAIELVLATAGESRERVSEEAADVIYHLLLLLRSRDVALGGVIGLLRKRANWTPA